MVELLAALLIATQPLSNYDHIPEPIPYDFNQCVRVFATDKGYKSGFDKPWARWNPPLEREDHALLEYYRQEGWGRLVLCDDKAS